MKPTNTVAERKRDGRFTAGNRAARKKPIPKFGFRPYEIPGSPPRGQQSRELEWTEYETHPEYGLTPARLATIFADAELGYLADQCDLFDGLREGDATLRNLYEQRRGSVSGKPRAWQPNGTEGDSKIAAAILDRAMRELPMKAALEHQATFNEYGYAVTEIVWGVKMYDGVAYIVPVRLINVPHRRFKIDPKTDELRLITSKNRTTGEALEPGRFWVTIKTGIRICRAGLGRTAAALAMFKRWGLRDWVIYSEKFGVPLVLAKIPASAPPEVKEAARAILANIGTDGGAVVEVPTDGTVDVEIVEASKADSQHTSAQLITYCNREMGKLVNGATLTNDNADSGGASYALGAVHADRSWENTLDDVAALAESQHCAIATPFVHWNQFADGTQPPELEIQVVRDQSPKHALDSAERLTKMRVPVSKTWLLRAVGARAPVGEGDSILDELDAQAAKAAPVAPGGAPAPASPDGTEPAADDIAPPAEGADPSAPRATTKTSTTAAATASGFLSDEVKLFEYHLGVVTVNEVRSKLRLEPVEGGEKYVSEWIAEQTPDGNIAESEGSPA